jgi:hypothetical protein
MTPLSANLIRTYVPIAIGAVASWLAARGIHVNAGTQAAAVVAMTGVFQAAYYTIVRVLEERWPAIGAVLLMARPAVAPEAVPFHDPQADDETSWPPPVEDGYHFPAQPSGSQVVYEEGPPASPAPPARPEMLRVRKADTGAIPAYRTPPGR